MATNDKAYNVFGKLPDGWIITLRIDRQGIASARVKERREDPGSLADLAKWCLLGNAPRPGGLALPASGISLEKRDEDGMWDCEWDFEGFAGDPNTVTFGDPATTTYELDCQVQNAPIETHPNFLSILKAYGSEGRLDKKTRQFQGFEPYLSDAVAAAVGAVPGGSAAGAALKGAGIENPLFGVEDYLVSNLTWRVSSVCRTLPNGFHKTLGTINTPRNDGGPPLPQLDGRANWLKTIASAVWRGNIFSTQEEWRASGPRGWNRHIYRAA